MAAKLTKVNGGFKIRATVSDSVIAHIKAFKKRLDVKTAWTARVDMTCDGNVLGFVRSDDSISWDETCANAVLQYVNGCISEFDTDETILATSVQQSYDALYQHDSGATVNKVRMFAA